MAEVKPPTPAEVLKPAVDLEKSIYDMLAGPIKQAGLVPPPEPKAVPGTISFLAEFLKGVKAPEEVLPKLAEGATSVITGGRKPYESLEFK